MLNLPINMQSTILPGHEPLTGECVMYEGKLCWSPFTRERDFQVSHRTCAECLQLTHLNHMEAVKKDQKERHRKDGLEEKLDGLLYGSTV